jgi:FkbM family methyltransferase
MSGIEHRIAEEVALARSVLTYHSDPTKSQAMDALYQQFIKPGDVAFDIGSHVGDRIASFRRLGAKVIALEPQDGPAGVIARIFAHDTGVMLVRSACAGREGTLTFRINSLNPTVSTASADFVKAADGAGGWEGQTWDREVQIPSTTLDVLIARHGMPAFVKIDVEGFEDTVLAGLSKPVPALSFEFTTIQRDIAFQCLDRLAALGNYGFDIALGESQTMTFGRYVSKDEMARHITDLPHAANSGDVYAVLVR